MVKALRDHLDKGSNSERQDPISDRELVEQQVDRIIVKSQAIEFHLKGEPERQAGEHLLDDESYPEASRRASSILTIPWSAAVFAEVKGILHSPSPSPTVSQESRDMLLAAIAKARAWIDDLVEGRVASVAEIAKQEGRVERHVRFLAPLAFVSPRTVSAILEGSAHSGLTVTDLAKAAAHSWAEQSQWIGKVP